MSGSVLILGPVLFSLLKEFIELVHIKNDKDCFPTLPSCRI